MATTALAKAPHESRRRVGGAALVGWAAIVFSTLYLTSDVIEAMQGGFSDAQLLLTLVAEAAIPLIVLGLYALQRPAIGRLGLASALAYAYAYVYFTATVVYALANGSKDFDSLSDQLGAWMTIHGAIMVLAGLGFGFATIRAGVLARWPAAALMAGVVLVALSQGMPEGIQATAAGVRDVGFAGLGLALLRTSTRDTTSARSHG